MPRPKISFGIGWRALFGEVKLIAGAIAEGNPDTAADAAALAAQAIKERYAITPTSAGQVLRAIANRLDGELGADDGGGDELCRRCAQPRSEHGPDHSFQPSGISRNR